jgi:hypothetical protein
VTGAGRAVVALAVAIMLLLTGAAGALLLAADDTPEPEDLLHSAQRWVRENRSAHFESRSRFEDAQDSGASDRLHAEGDLAAAGFRFHLKLGFGFEAEVLSVGGKTFARQGEDEKALAKAKWGELEGFAGASGAHTVDEESLTGPLPLTPAQLMDVVAHIKRPRLGADKDDDGWFQLTGAVDIDRAYPHAATALDSAQADLRVDRHGHLHRMLVKLEGPDGKGSADVRFSRWSRPVTLAAPAPDQIDPTPGIEEEAVAAFKAAPLFQPVAIPAGWVLDTAMVTDPGGEDGSCPEVEVFYTDPDNPDGAYLDLYESPASCADLSVAAGSSTFSAGPATGSVAPDQGDGILTGVLVRGSTALSFETDMDLATLAAVLGDLRPMDLAVTPAALGPVSSAA